MTVLSFWNLVIVCVLTHIIRTVYEILKHKQIIKANKISFIIVFTNMMLLWVSWFALCELDIYKIQTGFILRYTGLLISFMGVVMFITALLTIKSLEVYEGDLITKGIYSKVRHPMYLGFIFWFIGFPVFSGGLVSMFLSVLFSANVLFWRYLEEKELVKRFPLYREYKKKTIF